ncbi:hypothetical protein ACJ72_06002, partial [Emergomyces africanus]
RETDYNGTSGLDSRYMISRLRPTKFRVLSLTTIATPHRGSAFADYVFGQLGDVSSILFTENTEKRVTDIYNALARLKIESGAFSQLTRKYMQEEFNPNTPNIEDSHRIIEQEEGPNDGLVSVQSSRWGDKEGYKGTLVGVSHLDLINWTNRLKWLVSELTGNTRKWVLSICDVSC